MAAGTNTARAAEMYVNASPDSWGEYHRFISNLLRNDESAGAEFMATYHPKMAAAVGKTLGDSYTYKTAGDIASYTMLDVIGSRFRGFDANVGSLLSWLTTAAANDALNEIEHRKVEENDLRERNNEHRSLIEGKLPGKPSPQSSGQLHEKGGRGESYNRSTAHEKWRGCRWYWGVKYVEVDRRLSGHWGSCRSIGEVDQSVRVFVCALERMKEADRYCGQQNRLLEMYMRGTQ